MTALEVGKAHSEPCVSLINLQIYTSQFRVTQRRQRNEMFSV